MLFSRLKSLDVTRQNGNNIQSAQFKQILRREVDTQYIKSFGVTQNDSYERFAAKVPIVIYEDLAGKINQAICDKKRVLCSDKIHWAAKSSGTTNDQSKYIPITKRYLWQCHYRGAQDTMVTMLRNYPKTKAYSGDSLTLGGSQALIKDNCNIMAGDLSAILISNTPKIIDFIREPSRDIALMPDFTAKIDAICKRCVGKNITGFAGVPSWNLVLMRAVLDYTGKNNLLEVWPNMSLFTHGGISFDPYREQYKSLIPSDQMVYLETYNASEGFFALQDTTDHNDGMLLMLDYGVFYEFLPTDKLDDPSCAVPLWGVQLGITYAMIISNNSGLWRYMIGDTVQFTSIAPYRIKITGRTKQFINAFGEELMVSNADGAISHACKETNCVVSEYSVAPIFMGDNAKGAHEWVIEFEVAPADIDVFAQILDTSLQNLNSDYKAKRTNNATMNRLRINAVEKGTFFRWMSSRGKVGGQNKVPRLCGNRKYIDQLLNL